MRALAALVAGLGLTLGLGGCALQPGDTVPALGGKCWSPSTGWQDTPTGTCVYVGVNPPPTTTTTAPPELEAQ